MNEDEKRSKMIALSKNLCDFVNISKMTLEKINERLPVHMFISTEKFMNWCRGLSLPSKKEMKGICNKLGLPENFFYSSHKKEEFEWLSIKFNLRYFLDRIFEVNHITLEEFAKAINVQVSTVYNWYYTRFFPSFDAIKVIEDKYGVNIVEGFLSDGKSYPLSKEDTNSYEQLNEKINLLSDNSKIYVLSTLKCFVDTFSNEQ